MKLGEVSLGGEEVVVVVSRLTCCQSALCACLDEWQKGERACQLAKESPVIELGTIEGPEDLLRARGELMASKSSVKAAAIRSWSSDALNYF